MKSGIYQIINTTNNKVYIGKTNSLAVRERQHLKSLKDGNHYNKYLQRSFDKYGEESFRFEVIEVCEDESLIERERHWIKQKESEYADKGYNASYAYVLFNEYHRNRQINVPKRKYNEALNSPESRRKSRLGIIKHYSKPEARKAQSLRLSTLTIEEITELKNRLAFEFHRDACEISDDMKIKEVVVQHTAALNCYVEIKPELNKLIETRNERAKERNNKRMIRMWCEGMSTTDIGKEVGKHHRTVIRNLKGIRTDDIDRCRLNAINYVEKKRFRQVKTLKAMGYTRQGVSNRLGYAREWVSGVWDEEKPRTYSETNKARGISAVFKTSEVN